MSEVCVTSYDSIAKRRSQKRKERILMNSKQRIESILGAHGGEEPRKEPVLDGVQNCNNVFTASTSIGAHYDTHSSEISVNTAELSDKSIADGVSSELDSFIRSTPANEHLETFTGTQDEPWYSFIVADRLRTCITAGVILRIFVALSLLVNVVIPWILVYITVDYFIVNKCKSSYYQSCTLLLNGLNFFATNESSIGRIKEKFLIRTGYLIEKTWYFVQDSLLAAFAFLVMHVILHFAAAIRFS
ncbi:unnamed protein product [Anisakis simplex]|uniref:Uncharacterized protein n=1 Tax=Anisakis simplex TaxID=6269 RepID=A0A0M3JV49_ANISI|nr:unnamed protein product [Anisakis simplex]